MTKEILTGNAVRDWDPPETKALYWSGACQALVAAIGARGCKTSPIRDVLLKAHTEAHSDVLDALPDSVIEHHPGGLKSLQAARRRWIAENQKLGDDYARKAGLL